MVETHQAAMGPYFAVAEAAFELNSVTAVCREALVLKVWDPWMQACVGGLGDGGGGQGEGGLGDGGGGDGGEGLGGGGDGDGLGGGGEGEGGEGGGGLGGADGGGADDGSALHRSQVFLQSFFSVFE